MLVLVTLILVTVRHMVLLGGYAVSSDWQAYSLGMELAGANWDALEVCSACIESGGAVQSWLLYLSWRRLAAAQIQQEVHVRRWRCELG